MPTEIIYDSLDTVISSDHQNIILAEVPVERADSFHQQLLQMIFDKYDLSPKQEFDIEHILNEGLDNVYDHCNVKRTVEIYQGENNIIFVFPIAEGAQSDFTKIMRYARTIPGNETKVYLDYVEKHPLGLVMMFKISERFGINDGIYYVEYKLK